MRTRVILGLSALMCLAMAGVSQAAAVLTSTNYDGVKTAVTDEVSNAAPAALVLLGVIAAILIAIRLFKKVTGAKTA